MPRSAGSGSSRNRSAGRWPSNPAATAWGVDQLEVFAVFPDGELWDRYWDGRSWHPWESLGGELERRPARVLLRGRRPPRRLGARPRRPDLAPLVGRHALGRMGAARPMSGRSGSARCAGTSTPTGRRCSRPGGGPSGSASTRSGRGTTSTRSSAARPGRCSRAGSMTAAWAQATERIRIGLMVGANTFREPALDREDGDDARPHQQRPGDARHRRARGSRRSTRRSASSSGRRPPERLRWLGRGAAGHPRDAPRRASRRRRGTATTPARRPERPAAGPGASAALIGGGGEQVTLKLVARYADANNVGGGIASVRRKEEVLLRHCEAVGRDPVEIERTSGLGASLIRDRAGEAGAASGRSSPRTAARSRGRTSPSGRPRTSPRASRRYLELGYHHLIAGVPEPVRRGIDDAARDRGPAAPGALAQLIADPRAERARRPRRSSSRGLLLLPRAVAARLGPVAAASPCRTSAAARSGTVVEDPAAGVVGADPEPLGRGRRRSRGRSGSAIRARASSIASPTWLWPDRDAVGRRDELDRARGTGAPG